MQARAERLVSDGREPSSSGAGGRGRDPRTVPGALWKSLATSNHAPERESSRGEPLSSKQRAYFEPLFGASFEKVRIRGDAEAADAAREMGARAFAVGEDLVWGDQEARPGSGPAGDRLLAHELAHVVQQRRGAGLGPTATGEVEDDASRAATMASHGLPARVTKSAAAGVPWMQSRHDEPHPVPVLGHDLTPAGQRVSADEWVLRGFATDSDALTPEHEQVLARIAAELSAGGLGLGGFVTVVGHADSRGGETHNIGLGQRRASRVQERLAALVGDPQVAHEIRAYSSGTIGNVLPGDVPDYRQVTVTITRRTLAPTLPPLSTTPRPVPTPRTEEQQRPVVPPHPSTGPVGPRRSRLPPGFWNLPPPRPPSPDLIHQLSVAITGALGRAEIARLGAAIARALGLNEQQVRRDLDDALVAAGEEGLKEILRQLIQLPAGSPTDAPTSPYGPAANEIQPPPTIGPTIPF
jgi:outer membrane protein OmpA-like peptidoglycan-associated protein